MSALLETRGLTRRFGGLAAVSEVDFRLDAGEIRALIGPNGAGKTTFVSMLVGRIAPDAGAILFDGQDITLAPAHRRVRLGMAYTFQITSVFQRLTVFENVAVALRRRDDQGGAETQDAVDEVLARTGLSGTGGQLASELSYGHQRLLELAMGLAQRPRLLILDEPTQGLAEAEVAAFKALVRGLVPEVTVLLIEHNMGVVMELATRISVLNFGRLLAEGTPDEVRADASVREAYLGGAHA